MREKTGNSELGPKQEQLIFALLKYRTKGEAAAAAGINAATMYRWLSDPKFKAAYHRARADVFDDALAILQKGARQAAQTLVDESDVETSTIAPQERIKAAKAVLASAFRARDAILIEEELEELRQVIDALKSSEQSQEPKATPQEAKKDILSPEEQAEATGLRVRWMTAYGFDPESIENSLKFNRPQSVAEERHLFDVVQNLIDAEAASPPPHKE